jgi:hypothetical protein
MKQELILLNCDEWRKVGYLNKTPKTYLFSFFCVPDNKNINEESTSGRRENKIVSLIKHVETFFQMTEYLATEVDTNMTSVL